ncbi:unnamed protein product [Hymenolepis diminuta]|uniref:Uncharacterized protein n=1 Tax=Hymenolepis diminuta TaxID=6216 RepID=A0A564YJA6_HYMDI|nr:unnamed protein product [Hymenolepis diminuta]
MDQKKLTSPIIVNHEGKRTSKYHLHFQILERRVWKFRNGNKAELNSSQARGTKTLNSGCNGNIILINTALYIDFDTFLN